MVYVVALLLKKQRSHYWLGASCCGFVFQEYITILGALWSLLGNLGVWYVVIGSDLLGRRLDQSILRVCEIF